MLRSQNERHSLRKVAAEHGKQGWPQNMESRAPLALRSALTLGCGGGTLGCALVAQIYVHQVLLLSCAEGVHSRQRRCYLPEQRLHDACPILASWVWVLASRLSINITVQGTRQQKVFVMQTVATAVVGT